MSSQQTNNNFKINNFTPTVIPSELQPHYQPQVDNRMQVPYNTMLTTNLDLYIPRVSAGTTEEQIKTMFARSNIGAVDYCDLSLTKDKDTKKPQYLSAFVKLRTWSNLSGACEDFARNKTIKLYLSRETGEFWIILPNNNPLPRTHVNNSQLAAATDKLFAQTDALDKKMDNFMDDMRRTIIEMRESMSLQQQQIEELEFELKLIKNAPTFPEMKRETSVETALFEQYPDYFTHDNWSQYLNAEEEEADDADLDAALESHIQQKAAVIKAALERDFDAEVDALLDAPLTKSVSYSEPMMTDSLYSSHCKPASPFPTMTRGVSMSVRHEETPVDCSPLPQMTRGVSMSVRHEETVEENLMGLFAKPPALTRSVSVFRSCNDDECLFSNKQGQTQRRSPIQVQSTVATKSLTLGEIVAENFERAIGSRDLCGNL